MVSIAREGAREIVLAALVLAAAGWALAAWMGWPAALPCVLLFGAVLWFFRDPRRNRAFAPGEVCSAADGTVTEVTELDHYEPLGAPAVRIGAFLSLLNVHVNRAPCAGVVRRVEYRPGAFLDARHPESGRRNESNTLLIDPDEPLPGPIEVRQVAGWVARRIICHAREGDRVATGQRFGLIKFGSRTEVIIPRVAATEIRVRVGDPVRGGLTVLAFQPVVDRDVARAVDGSAGAERAIRAEPAAPTM